MKPLITLLIIAAALILMWGVAAVKMNAPPEPQPPAAITQEMYDQICEGMTVEEVEAIIGKSGNVMSDTTPAGKTYNVSTWTGANWAFIRITFVDGKVTDRISRYLK